MSNHIGPVKNELTEGVVCVEEIPIIASDAQPSADPAIEDEDEDDYNYGEDERLIDTVDDETNKGFVYKGIETTHTFEAMDTANKLIGGSNIGTTSTGKLNYITLEDRNDEDTNELKNYKNFNKDHKIFAFQFPLGANNKVSNQSVSMFKPVSPLDTASSLEKDVKRMELKEKLKRSDSLDSLEEMLLFENEKGNDNARGRAIKQTMGMENLRQQFKQMTMDEAEMTKDGYSYKRLETIWDELDGDIVILGGYRGSILRDTHTGRRIWVPIKAGLNLRKIDLLIGPNQEDEIATQKDIIPDGMLTHVGPIDVAKKLIRKLDSNQRVNIQEFGYDWRLSLEVSSGQLKDRLTKIYNRQKSETKLKGRPKGTYVIAHSMGGLVAHKVLQDAPYLIRGLIYVGSPSQCSNILGPIRFGDDVMWNKTILSKEANFFMRSSLYFLPLDGRCFVDSKTYERYDLDFFDPEVWKMLGLSPLVSEKRKKFLESEKEESKSTTATSSTFTLTSVPVTAATSVAQTLNATTKFVFNNVPLVNKVTKDANAGVKYNETIKPPSEYEFKTTYEDSVAYLERELKRTKKYLESLEYDATKIYPPLAIVYGNKVPTVRGCKVDGLKDIRDGHYDDFYYGPGDGVVHYKWLLPERRGFPVVCKIASDTGHVSLMTDFKAIAKAFISIVDAENERDRLAKEHFMG
ncbi:hypothetical protein KAFR_0G00900 [Kazachstania africana CBS 2517]|uniref:Uncharacterized protein n=1 Tax=Kazachstania africana (strain ATCC 22294 / BCRC 22015 / CBS 2517 / CECT 1963 / NBRC 1671 / NRRL Y-8276) TaxID=1071382 RepID=H2AXM3_KAZAF|nr:hypothetical protein KAFR_0G00900 [Kazachstania africana CBS 2517]CCF59123.1 hypothetical protein KAFR_0G00900 [Kazachstania africana CBS 2517]